MNSVTSITQPHRSSQCCGPTHMSLPNPLSHWLSRHSSAAGTRGKLILPFGLNKHIRFVMPEHPRPTRGGLHSQDFYKFEHPSGEQPTSSIMYTLHPIADSISQLGGCDRWAQEHSLVLKYSSLMLILYACLQTRFAV